MSKLGVKKKKNNSNKIYFEWLVLKEETEGERDDGMRVIFLKLGFKTSYSLLGRKVSGGKWAVLE